MATMEKLAENPNSGALGWLMEMELINNPYVLNTLILNVFKLVDGLKDAQFVIDSKGKKLLIYLELGWFSRKFRQMKIQEQVLEMLDQILPAFKKRVVFDKSILEKAVKLLNEKEYGALEKKEAK